MQPESRPLGGQEIQAPAPAASSERIPVLPAPEAGIETGAERVEQRAEAQAAVADAAAPAMPIAQPVDPMAADPSSTSSSSPAVAAHDDVIEKEWVDRAKQILEETKDDPHGRTEKVNQLQKDYLRKRYGKELGAA